MVDMCKAHFYCLVVARRKADNKKSPGPFRSAKCQTVPLLRYSVDVDHEHVWRRELRYDSVPAYHAACELRVLTDASEFGYSYSYGGNLASRRRAIKVLTVLALR
eukprot:scaffold575632_cov19-Prasinocladus_malaysianus.AAC.1